MSKERAGDRRDKDSASLTTGKRTEARLKEKLGARGTPLRALEVLGDERGGGDQLRGAPMIPEGVETGENPGV